MPDASTVSPRPSSREAALATGLVIGLMLPVAYAVGDHGALFAVTALAGGGSLALAVALALPFRLVFALGASICVAGYTCLYVILGRTAFPAIHPWADPVAFLLPVLGFMVVLRRRRGALAMALSQGDDGHLAAAGRWMLWCTVVALACLSLPMNRLSTDAQTAALLLAMAVVTALSLSALQALVLLLADVADILAGIAARLRFLAAPIVTFTLLFALLTIAFGCAYRIADGLSARPLFQRYGELARLDFAETLHFSVVTLATVGYGDILPVDEGVRLMASVQMLLGQLLLLFGFAEVMRQRIRAEPPRPEAARSRGTEAMAKAEA
jgi:voltage-gated potassium channel Kch